jgi:gliding motility-associated-like protein
MSSATAQRNKNWYFGNYNAFKFENDTVIALSNSAMLAAKNSVSMSDRDGNLLFYSNGFTVWNRSGNIMDNGDGLYGNNELYFTGSFQVVNAAPMPGNDSLYYLFHYQYTSGYIPNYCYSIINMAANSGLGKVIVKNIVFSPQAASSLVTVQHANNRDFWIIARDENYLIYKSYLLSDTGLSSQPVISDYYMPTPISRYEGNMRLSPDRRLALLALGSNSSSIGNGRLFHFNSTTGILSNLSLTNNDSIVSSFCFSPNSKRIYYQYLDKLYQHTIVNDSILPSSSNAFQLQSITSTDLEAGPDGRIYLSYSGGNTQLISCILNPNDSGAACNFKDTVLLLTNGNANSLNWLPTFYSGINSRYLALYIKQTACNSFSFVFGSNSKGVTVKHWDLGDGTIMPDSSFTHTYNPAIADSFLVTLTLIANDTTLVQQQWVHLAKPPVASFSFATSGCVGDSVHLSASAITSNNAPIHQYYWNLGDGSIDSTQHIIKHYVTTDTTTFFIKLWATDTLGCVSDTVVHSVALNKKAVAGFGVVAPLCDNAMVQLSDSSKGLNTNINYWAYYLFNNSNTLIDSVKSNATGNQSYSFPSSGSYNIHQVVSSNNGCISDTATHTIIIHDKPVAGMILPQDCVSDLSQFTDTSHAPSGEAIAQWHWQFGDPNATFSNADTSILQNATHQYSQAGNYNIQLTVTSNNGCKDTLTKQLTINGALPKAALSWPLQGHYCSGDTIRFTDLSTVDFGSIIKLKWIWDNTDSISVNNPLPNNSYGEYFAAFGIPATKNMDVRLIVQSGVSCVSTKDTTITLAAQPKVVFAPLDNICQNAMPVTLTQVQVMNGAVGNGWYTGAGITNNTLDPMLLSAGIYPVQYTFTTAIGCRDSATQHITILDTPYVDAGSNKTILEGGQVQLTATAFGTGINYLWQPPTTLNDATLLQPMASPSTNTTYKLLATLTDGCSAQDTVHVQVLGALVIPNAFSPNGDGVNDKWEIPHLDSYPNAKIWVYDRSGRLVFESINYTTAWDGTLNGKPLPIGVYYYIIEPGSGRKAYSGGVMLVR